MDKKDKLISITNKEKTSKDAMCGYCHLYINDKCSVGHKIVNSYSNCKDLIPIN